MPKSDYTNYSDCVAGQMAKGAYQKSAENLCRTWFPAATSDTTTATATSSPTTKRMTSALSGSEARKLGTKSTTSTSPLTSQMQSVSQMYTELLGRPIAQEGMDYWSQQLQNGASLEDVRWAIQQSPEYQQYQQQPSSTSTTDRPTPRPPRKSTAGTSTLSGADLQQQAISQLTAAGMSPEEAANKANAWYSTSKTYDQAYVDKVNGSIQSYVSELSGGSTQATTSTTAGTTEAGGGDRWQEMPVSSFDSQDVGIRKTMEEQAAGSYPYLLPQHQAATVQDVVGEEGLAAAEMTGEGQKLTEPAPTVGMATATAAPDVQVADIEATKTYEATKIGEAAQMKGVTMTELDSRALVEEMEVKGELTEGAKAVAVTEALDTKALVQTQLGMLLGGLENGEVPAWAKPAVAMAENELASRGFSNSTVARDALYNAIITSAMPIASQDAQTEYQAWAKNLDNKQQAVMFNAAQQANMDMQNASASQQAAIQNAQAFLQLEFTNLNNQQQAAEMNAQFKQQQLLTDAAADNAAKQFNATSENQRQEFITQLKASIDSQNAARRDAVSQFNAGNQIDINKYNATMEQNQRMFNAQMAAQIEQSNVEWRRQVNLADTAAVNLAHQQNIQNKYNLTATSQAALWNEYADKAAAARRVDLLTTMMTGQYAAGVIDRTLSNPEVQGYLADLFGMDKETVSKTLETFGVGNLESLIGA